MVQNKAEIASESTYNPRASMQGPWVGPGPRPQGTSRFAHIILSPPPPPPPPKTVLALSGCTGVSSGPSENKFENLCSRHSLSDENKCLINQMEWERLTQIKTLFSFFDLEVAIKTKLSAF